jgi:[ribosomal protein S18]-alanine N-acetyltransferase
MSPLELRPGGPGDLAALLAVERGAMRADAWSEQVLADELAGVTGGRWVVVADLDAEPVGYAVLMVAGGTADVLRVAVTEAHRRRGLGRLLVDALAAEAARRGCEAVLLEVAEDNVTARALYAAAGYVEIARRDDYYGRGRSALVLRLGLAQ